MCVWLTLSRSHTFLYLFSISFVRARVASYTSQKRKDQDENKHESYIRVWSTGIYEKDFLKCNPFVKCNVAYFSGGLESSTLLKLFLNNFYPNYPIATKFPEIVRAIVSIKEEIFIFKTTLCFLAFINTRGRGRSVVLARLLDIDFYSHRQTDRPSDGHGYIYSVVDAD